MIPFDCNLHEKLDFGIAQLCTPHTVFKRMMYLLDYACPDFAPTLPWPCNGKLSSVKSSYLNSTSAISIEICGMLGSKAGIHKFKVIDINRCHFCSKTAKGPSKFYLQVTRQDHSKSNTSRSGTNQTTTTDDKYYTSCSLTHGAPSQTKTIRHDNILTRLSFIVT